MNKPSDPLVLLPDYETVAALGMWPDNRTLMIACHGAQRARWIRRHSARGHLFRVSPPDGTVA